MRLSLLLLFLLVLHSSQMEVKPANLPPTQSIITDEVADLALSKTSKGTTSSSDEDYYVSEDSSEDTSTPKKVPAAEVEDISETVTESSSLSATTAEEPFDYSDFDTTTAASKELKPVTFKPLPQTYSIPPLIEREGSLGGGRGGGGRPRSPPPPPPPPPGRQGCYRDPCGIPLRTGYFFQHFPYWRLPRAFRLNPSFRYVYPPQYQNAFWQFHGPVPYQDVYGVYSGDYKYGYFSGWDGYGYREDERGNNGCGGGGGGCGGRGGGYGGGGRGRGRDRYDEKELVEKVDLPSEEELRKEFGSEELEDEDSGKNSGTASLKT